VLSVSVPLDQGLLNEIERRIARQAEVAIALIVQDRAISSSLSVRTVLTRVVDGAWDPHPITPRVRDPGQIQDEYFSPYGPEPAWLLRNVFGEDLHTVLVRLKARGYDAREMEEALTYVEPALTLGQKVMLMRDAGASAQDLYLHVLWGGHKDASVYPVLKQLGLNAAQAHHTLELWGLKASERIELVDQAGYTPT
jgi:hypothetical protein